jgi:hypothetical protein
MEQPEMQEPRWQTQHWHLLNAASWPAHQKNILALLRISFSPQGDLLVQPDGTA